MIGIWRRWRERARDRKAALALIRELIRLNGVENYDSYREVIRGRALELFMKIESQRGARSNG